MASPKTILRNLPLAIGIAFIAVLFVFAAFHKSPLTLAHPPDPGSLPPIAPPPAWNGANPTFVIRLQGDERGSGLGSTHPTLRHVAPVNQCEVDLHTGMFILRQTDLFQQDSIPLVLTRTYRPWDEGERAFGRGANHPYDITPVGTRNPYTWLNLILEDGTAIYYPRISPGTGFQDAVYRHDQTSSEFYNSQVAWNGNGWTLKFADSSQVTFPDGYNARNFAQSAPVAMHNAIGATVTFDRDFSRNLKTLTSPSGHTIRFRYDGRARIVEARSDHEVRQYEYDPSGHLHTVSDGSQVLYEFVYEPLIHQSGFDPYLMTSIRGGNGKEIVHNFYVDGRVSGQRLPSRARPLAAHNEDVFRYRYTFGAANSIVAAFVTLPDGQTIPLVF